jgi:DNA-binding response OmpR family regulator
MLTARRDEADKLLGFEVGADDYVTKPFSPRELVARVRALLRRSGSVGAGEEVLERGALRIDPGRRMVVRDGVEIPLTSLEFDLLHHLARKPGRVYGRAALLDQVWGEGRVVDERSIDSLVRRLRRKLEPDPGHPTYVQTVWGAGYRFGDGT